MDELETKHCSSFLAARFATLDANIRSQEAEELHPAFFNDPAHIDRVEQVKQIVKNFFTGSTVYVNKRGLGNRRPFTVIKVERPTFPNYLSKKDKDNRFYKPLAAINVRPMFAKGTDSYLFRVY